MRADEVTKEMIDTFNLAREGSISDAGYARGIAAVLTRLFSTAVVKINYQEAVIHLCVNATIDKYGLSVVVDSRDLEHHLTSKYNTEQLHKYERTPEDMRIAELQAELDKLRAESAEDQQRLMFLNSQHGLMYTLIRSTVYSSLDLWRHAIDRYQRTNVHAPKPETPDDS